MLKVKVRNGNIEGALKQLKRKVRNVKQKEELRDRQQYTKKSEIKRMEKQKAEYKENMYREHD